MATGLSDAQREHYREHGYVVARGVLEAVGKMDVKVPMVVRMAGTRAEEGLKLLEGSPLIPAASPTEAAQKIIDLVNR